MHLLCVVIVFKRIISQLYKHSFNIHKQVALNSFFQNTSFQWNTSVLSHKIKWCNSQLKLFIDCRQTWGQFISDNTFRDAMPMTACLVFLFGNSVREESLDVVNQITNDAQSQILDEHKQFNDIVQIDLVKT